MSSQTLKPAGAALVATGLLTACLGGGGGDGMPVTPPADATSVPDSALVSSNAYEQFVATTAATSSETAEPLTAGKLDVAPSSETDEPASLS